MCTIKILEALIAVQIDDFASRRSVSLESGAAKDFLVSAHPDMVAMQSECLAALNLVPYHIGTSDAYGNITISASNLNDTGVLTVKRLLQAIEQIDCIPSDVKLETKNIMSFLETHRHVLRQS